MHPTTTAPPAVLVTGASRGLGAAITRRLADDGFLVFAGTRAAPASGPDGERAGDPRVVPVHLDVTEPDSIARAVDVVARHLGGRGLHGLVNNAAVLEAAPLEATPLDSARAQLDTNVLGPIATTQAFLPLLRLQAGRIVNVSSINAHLPLPSWGVYSATKAALVALSDAWRLELQPWHIPVTVLTLGAFATDIRQRRGWAEHPRASLYGPTNRTMAALTTVLDASAGDPELVGATVADLLHRVDPPAEVALGDGIDELLALAAQPAEVRQAAIGQLLASMAVGPLAQI